MILRDAKEGDIVEALDGSLFLACSDTSVIFLGPYQDRPSCSQDAEVRLVGWAGLFGLDPQLPRCEDSHRCNDARSEAEARRVLLSAKLGVSGLRCAACAAVLLRDEQEDELYRILTLLGDAKVPKRLLRRWALRHLTRLGEDMERQGDPA